MNKICSYDMNYHLVLLFLLFNINTMSAQSIILEDFQSTPKLQWQIINDGVMGGLSDSQMNITSDGYGLFTGAVSLDNNGGFASTRGSLPTPIKQSATTIKIRIKGDGKKYSFRIQPNNSYRNVSYKLDFPTIANQWEEIEFPLEDFIPTWRGRLLSDVPPIVAGAIGQIGFLISDKQEGEFELLIDWIKLH